MPVPKQRTDTSTTLWCFNPPVMAATFLVEMALAGYTLYRYRRTLFTQLSVVLLACLAIFQLAEFGICTSSPTSHIPWSRFGVAAISLLPPLGLHLVALLTAPTLWVTAGYICGGFFAATILTTSSVIVGPACLGNYVIFGFRNPHLGLAFSFFYAFFIIVALSLIAHDLLTRPQPSVAQRQAKLWLGGGYLGFLVPMAFVYAASPQLLGATPSIMCGFAVTLAFILTLRVLPAVHANEEKELAHSESQESMLGTA